MSATIYQLHKKDKASLGTVRCINGLMAAAEGDTIWLRDDATGSEVAREMLQLPVRNTFYTDASGHLIPKGALTPVNILKELDWQPLAQFIPVTAPVAALPGQLTLPSRIQLNYSGVQRPGRALLTSLTIWKQYAESAPEVRLQLMHFAVEESGDVLIVGALLPPLPGKEFWMINDIYIPAGYDFDNSLIPVLLARQLNEEHKAVLIFDVDGNWQSIDKNYFIKGKRSAIRLTKC